MDLFIICISYKEYKRVPVYLMLCDTMSKYRNISRIEAIDLSDIVQVVICSRYRFNAKLSV